MQRICGFLVVRKSEQATNEQLKPQLRIGETIYRGVDRLRWEDLDRAYYEGRLPADLLHLWTELDRDSNDFSGISVLKSYANAKEVLRFSGDRSEIIAIWSPELEITKGTIQSDIHLRYLGIDCYCLGEWSLLLNGVYERPDLFAETVARLNEHGLLNDEAECIAAREIYRRLETEELVEPLAVTGTTTSLRVFDVIES
jgi:hypothetical protein